MVITFPVLVSETVDKDILPYLLKAIERKFALDYIPILQKLVKKELLSNVQSVNDNVIESIVLEGDGFDKTKLMEGDSIGIQVVTADSNKINSDQPFFITLKVTTESRIQQDFVFGFKALSLISPNALNLFTEEMDVARYWLHKNALKLFGDRFSWFMTKWYTKMFDSKYSKSREFATKKVLFSENRERIALLSINDLTREELENNDPETTPISTDNLEDSRWSALYLDDSLNKRIYMWDQQIPKFSTIITYDMLYKNNLNVLPEQMDKAKQRNTSLFSKKAPMSWVIEKVFGKRRK